MAPLACGRSVPATTLSPGGGPAGHLCDRGGPGHAGAGQLSTAVSVRVPGKVNIHFGVGSRRADGYHELATIFQAVSIYDKVTVTPADQLRITVGGTHARDVPAGPANLAAQAATLIGELTGQAPRVHIHVHKRLPAAGGMAGGSADAAATLVACNALWDSRLGSRDLQALALQLGSDVPFTLLGGTATGHGRGELLTPLAIGSDLHWVFAFAARGLSTPDVYAEFDRVEQRSTTGSTSPVIPAGLCDAVSAGASGTVAKLLHNDLEKTVFRLRPDLRRVRDAGLELGACGAVISGTGASCAFLATDKEAALRLAAALRATGTCLDARYAVGPAGGPQILPAA